jgi:hypothetical protein
VSEGRSRFDGLNGLNGADVTFRVVVPVALYQVM